MIKATVVGSERINQKFDNMPGNVTMSIAKRIQIILFTLEGNVKSKKLTGQALHVRTNRLRSSIHASDVAITADKVSGTVGTNVIYAAAHEYGFNGSVNVKAHLRNIKQAFGHKLKSPVTVKVNAFTRQMRIPESSFLRSQLQEDQSFINQQIELGAMEGAKA